MRSETIGPEDFDADLSEDLALLGERLTADASRLAARYPAREPGMWLAADEAPASGEPTISANVAPDRASPRRSASWWQTVATLAVAIALLATAWQWLNAPLGSAPQEHRHPNFDAVPATNDPDAAGEEVDKPSVVPAGVFESLSAPEQEGLLDLMESEGIPQPTISL